MEEERTRMYVIPPVQDGHKLNHLLVQRFLPAVRSVIKMVVLRLQMVLVLVGILLQIEHGATLMWEKEDVIITTFQSILTAIRGQVLHAEMGPIPKDLGA